jgi:hypothetical protein
MSRLRRLLSSKRPPETLDKPLLSWTNRDPFTLRHLLSGGISIIGRAGSGKTSSSGKQIGRAIVRHKRSGGLILAAKPEDATMWQGIFEQTGRAEDLAIFAPDQPHRFNLLGYVLAMGGHTRDVTRCVTTVGETLRGADTKGGESADFWEREQERMIYNAVEVVKLATGTVSAPHIQKFIGTAASSPAMIATPEWQAKFCNQCLAAAFSKLKTPVAAHDYQLAADYWLMEYPSMADKTRSSILTGVMGILHVFNTGVVRELVSTTTNISPDDMLAGKWVLVNMSPAEWGDMGALVCAGWKFLTQKRVLRRKAADGDCINVIWADESQQFVNSFDSHYLAQCRSHLGCMIYLTQSLHSYYSALKGDAGRSQADALLTNFHTKIFHAIGDVKTAEWASGLVGRSRQTFIGSSIAPVENLFDEIMGRSKVTTNASEQYEQVLQNNAFMNGMRTGGLESGLICDAIVIRSGEPFAHGQNWLWVQFSQKG